MTTFNLFARYAVLATTFASASAMAYEAGDFIVRAGWARVMPNVGSEQVGAIAGSKVDVDDSNSLGLTFDYLLTDNIGVGLLGALPFTLDINGDGSISALGKVGETKALPPVLTVKWYPSLSEHVHPYVGVGVNYTYFWDEKGKGGTVTDLSLDDSWGLAGEVGLDVSLGSQWLVSAQLYYIQLNTTGKTNVGDVDVDLDPWAFMLGVGRRF